MLSLVLFSLWSLDSVTGWQCPNGKLVPGIYTNSGQPSIIGFQTTIQTFDGVFEYSVTAFNNSNLYSAIFYNNVLRNERLYFESEFIGDASRGNFTVKTNGVHRQDGGVYMLQYQRGAADWYTEMCFMLYVLGKPQKATVSHDNNNVLGRNSQLTCDSLSTTYPTNHTLSLAYNWKVNDITNPSNTRYRYGASKKTLTIMSVSKEDANKTFECSATESGDGVTGLTSDYSDEFLLAVIYGPDSITTKLAPANTEYTLNEGLSLNDITCVGDCYPRCNFKWTKQGTNGASIVSNNAVLSLGTLSRAEAATYTCDVTNVNATVRTERKQVVVHVNYGPDTSTTILTPASTSITLVENTHLADIVCAADCHPECQYKWTKPDNTVVSNIGVLSLGSLNRNKATTYTCTVTNSQTAVSLTKQVSVIVIYSPDVNVSLSADNITEGNTLTLSCDAKGVPSVYSYNGLTQTWNGIPVPNTHTEVSGTPRFSSLHIPFLQLQDSGTYTCYVNNGVKTADSVSSVTVKVKVLPKVFTRLSMFAERAGGTVNVSVQFYSFPDIDEVGFKRYDDQIITNDTSSKYIVSHYETAVRDKFYGKEVSLRGRQANLVISDLKQEDFGSYTLILKNELGKTITQFSIDEKRIHDGEYSAIG